MLLPKAHLLYVSRQLSHQLQGIPFFVEICNRKSKHSSDKCIHEISDCFTKDTFTYNKRKYLHNTRKIYLGCFHTIRYFNALCIFQHKHTNEALNPLTFFFCTRRGKYFFRHLESFRIFPITRDIILVFCKVLFISSFILPMAYDVLNIFRFILILLYFMLFGKKY